MPPVNEACTFTAEKMGFDEASVMVLLCMAMFFFRRFLKTFALKKSKSIFFASSSNL